MLSRFLLFFLFIGFSLTLAQGSAFAQAQITKTLRLELNEESERVFIGNNAVIYSDPKQELSFESFNTPSHIPSRSDGAFSTLASSKILNLGLDNNPAWIVFSVSNISRKNLWYLDLGDLFDGRLAQIRELDIYQNSTKKNHKTAAKALVFSYGAQANKPINPNIPLVIGRGRTETVIIRLSGTGFLPTTIVPSIQSEIDRGFNLITHPVQTLFLIGLTVLFGVFLGSLIIRKTLSHLGFVGYFGSLLLLFLLLQNIVFAPWPILTNIIYAVFGFHILASLFAAKNFLKIDSRYYIPNLMIYTLMLFVFVCSIAVIFIPSVPPLLKSVLIFVPSFISIVAIIAASYLHTKHMNNASYYFSLAWLPVLLSSLITALCGAGMIGTNIFSVHAYWIALPVQAVLFMIAVKFRLELDDTEMQNVQAQEMYELQSIERLKKSKESVDQSRLMRVIERERELMAELREREMKRTEEMRYARNTADEANKAKSGFLAVISHEIRTPLNGLMGTLRLLNDTNMAKEQSDLLSAIHTSCENMMAMLNDLLDFEKIEKGHMTLEIIRFDMEKLVKDSIALMSGHTKGKDLSLGYEIDPTLPRFIQGDPTRIRQILLNLINNAVKFTPSGTIQLTLKNESNAEQTGEQAVSSRIRFEVRDSGIGISKEAQRNLFDPFHQADETITRKYGGTGLGLAICKSIVEVMGGTLSVDSEEGEGSAFYFTINLEHAEDTGDVTAEGSSHTYSNTVQIKPAEVPLHILIIEDNEINSSVLSKFLEKNNHTSQIAPSGEEALDIVQTEMFDAIILDVWLPGLSGIETAQQMRQLKDNKNATRPYIAVTGTTSPETVEEIKNAGINEYIQKPIDFDQLLSVLDGIEAQQDRSVKETAAPDIAGDDALSMDDLKENKISPIHKYVRSQDVPPDTDSNEGAAPVIKIPSVSADPEDASDIEESWFHRQTLQSLSDALPIEQEVELFEGFSKKRNELVEKLNSVLDAEKSDQVNEISLMNWAHELKGMAANFGMSEISALCENIETNIRAGKETEFKKAIGQLTQANEHSQKVIDYWTTRDDRPKN